MGVRKLMDYVFSPIDMYWLDHMLPGEERVKREDEQVSKRYYRFIYYLTPGPYFRGVYGIKLPKW